jgi:stage V sporulation protein G
MTMGITIGNVQIKMVKEEKPVMAYCSFVINNCFAVHKVRIVEGKNKSFRVCMPSYKSKLNGEFLDICHPINQQTRKQINEVILGTFMHMLKAELFKTEDNANQENANAKDDGQRNISPTNR